MNRLSKFAAHPAVTVASIIVGVIGTAFAIWSHLANQPARELSVWRSVRTFADMDNANGFSIPIQGASVSQGKIYIVEISIWNSGNQEIASEHFLVPLRMQTKAKWTEHQITYFGIDSGALEGSLETGAKVNRLFPKSGLRISFLSTQSEPNIVLTGAISGGLNAGGIADRRFDTFNSIVNKAFGSATDFGSANFWSIFLFVMVMIPPIIFAIFAWNFGRSEKRSKIVGSIMLYLIAAHITYLIAVLIIPHAVNFFFQPPF